MGKAKTIESLEAQVSRLEDELAQAQSALGDSEADKNSMADRISDLEDEAEKVNNSRFFAKAAPCFERMAERRVGFVFHTKEEEDIMCLLELFREWRANNA